MRSILALYAPTFGRESTSRAFALMMRLIGSFLASPEKGVRTSIYLATAPEVEGVTGKYFIDKQEQDSNAESYDTAVAQRLWQVSEELTGLA